MKTVLPLVAGLLGCMLIIAPECLPQNKKKADPDVVAVQALLEQPTGFSSGFSEKESNRLGDRVAIALQKIFNKQELQSPENIQKFLPVIRSAFLYPELIPKAYKMPKVTIALLSRLERDVNDAQIKRDISDVRQFVVEQTRRNRMLKVAVATGFLDIIAPELTHNLGSAKLNFEPLPTSDSTLTDPPCCSMTSFTKAKPRPVDSSSFSWPSRATR